MNYEAIDGVPGSFFDVLMECTILFSSRTPSYVIVGGATEKRRISPIIFILSYDIFLLHVSLYTIIILIFARITLFEPNYCYSFQ